MDRESARSLGITWVLTTSGMVGAAGCVCCCCLSCEVTCVWLTGLSATAILAHSCSEQKTLTLSDIHQVVHS